MVDNQVAFQASAVGKQIGFVVDLTATQKYYDPCEWTNVGIKYEKIWCMGHDVNIQVENIKKFYTIVSEFLSKHVYTGLFFPYLHNE